MLAEIEMSALPSRIARSKTRFRSIRLLDPPLTGEPAELRPVRLLSMRGIRLGLRTGLHALAFAATDGDFFA
eukprot:5564060-Prymnesium_polylepis.3